MTSNRQISDPEAKFGTPRQVLAQENLSRCDKLEILKRWQLNLIELQRASTENMQSAGNESGLVAEQLQSVALALAELDEQE